MAQIDHAQVGKTAYQLALDHGSTAHELAAQKAEQALDEGDPDEAEFWEEVVAALRPHG